MRLRLLCLALALASAPTLAQAPSQAPARKTIAVVSALGDEVRSVHVGITVFNNEFGSRTVDWQIDRALSDRIVQALAQRFDARALAVDGRAIAKESLNPNVWIGTTDLETPLRAAVKPGAYDLVLVVAPVKEGNSLQNPSLVPHGVGVHTFQNVFRGRDNGHVYLICAMTLFDGHTLKKLDRDKCQSDSSFAGLDAPNRKLPQALYKQRLEALSAEQMDELRLAVLALLDETVPLTLRELKLTVDAKPGKATPERPPREESTR